MTDAILKMCLLKTFVKQYFYNSFMKLSTNYLMFLLFTVEYRTYKRNEKKITTAKAVTKAFMGM